MRAQQLHYLGQVAKEEKAKRQQELDDLTLLVAFNCYEEYGYSREEINQRIADLQKK